MQLTVRPQTVFTIGNARIASVKNTQNVNKLGEMPLALPLQAIFYTSIGVFAYRCPSE